METRAFEDKLVAAAQRVLVRLQEELDRNGGAKASKETLIRLDFARGDGLLGPDGRAHPRSRQKFLVNARNYIGGDRKKLPYLKDIKSAFEIGVGAGYLFAMLKELLHIKMSGIDIDFQRNMAFTEMRKELGIADQVFEHRVKARSPIPIPSGTEAVIAFRPMFDEGWSVADHEYFLADCGAKLVDKKLVIMNFNPRYLKADGDVTALYRRRGTLPIPDNDVFFVIPV